jgi:hypothetical protein
VIDNKLLSDSRLSWKAKKPLCYLLSKLNGWEIIHKDIIQRSTDSDESVRTAMRELRKFGYTYEKVARNEKGQIAKRELIVDERPLRGGSLNQRNPD